MTVAMRAFSWLAPALWRIPGVGERAAARLFLTPLGRPRSSELTLPHSVGSNLEVIGSAGPFSVRRYGKGEPVFLVHGWGGQGAQMNGFVDPLVERGYSVYTVDLPAHGASRRNRRTHVGESSSALLALERYAGSPRAIVAHSYGAAAASVAAARGLATDALVFVAPLPSLDVAVAQFAERALLPTAVVERAAVRIERQLGISRSTTDLARLGTLLQSPLLLVHDRADRIISHEHSEKLTAAWPGARLLSTHGLGHQRILRDSLVIDRAVGFIEQRPRQRRSDLSDLLFDL